MELVHEQPGIQVVQSAQKCRWTLHLNASRRQRLNRKVLSVGGHDEIGPGVHRSGQNVTIPRIIVRDGNQELMARHPGFRKMPPIFCDHLGK